LSFHETGDIENSVWSCGSVMSLIDEVLTCEDLINRMVAEAEAELLNAPNFVVH